MNIAVVYHQPSDCSDAWSTPLGLATALASEGAHVVFYPFANPVAVTLPPLSKLLADQIDVVLIFYAGASASLDSELIKLRLLIDDQLSALKIICELGDEPQTRCHNAVRAQVSDLCLSPDDPSALKWRSLGAPCVWYTHWADTSIFHESQERPREQLVVTTMGRRRYAKRLRLPLPVDVAFSPTVSLLPRAWRSSSPLMWPRCITTVSSRSCWPSGSSQHGRPCVRRSPQKDSAACCRLIPNPFVHSNCWHTWAPCQSGQVDSSCRLVDGQRRDIQWLINLCAKSFALRFRRMTSMSR